MNFFRNKKGLTTVELLVVLTIGVILFSVIGLSLFGYSNYANFKRQNEYAQTLFVAAQNTLTRFSQNGEDEDVAISLERYKRTLSANMLEGKAKEKFLSDYENRVYYITINKDGTVYSSNTTESEKALAQNIFNRLFDSSVYDKAILLNASITIEFDPVQCVVYSVLYSDLNNGFQYGNSGNYTSISNRDREYRQKNKIGYYGIETLQEQTSRNKDKPVIEKVNLINSNSLYLTFKLTDKYAKTSTGDLSYDVDIYTASGLSPTLLMRISLTDIKALYSSKESTNSYEELMQNYEVIIYNSDGTVEKTATYPFIAFVDNEYVVHLYLDSLDLAVEEYKTASEASMAIQRFALNLSALNLSEHNIYANVRAYGSKYKNSAWKRSNVENMLFATGKAGLFNTCEYTITNARHLNNVRYAEEFLEIFTEDSNTYKITENFDWIGTNSPFNAKYGSEVFTNGKETQSFANGQYTAFITIPTLCENSTLTSASKAIANLVIRNEQGTNVGLVGTNYGTIKTLTLNSPQIVGGNGVGAFCGANYGTLEFLTTNSGTVSGKTNVGGIFGENKRLIGVYQNLHNGSDVKGKQYVGGIVGQLVGENLSISSCTNKGFIQSDLGDGVTQLERIIANFLEHLVDLAQKGIKVNYNTDSASLADENNFINIFKKLCGDYLTMDQSDFNAINAIIETRNLKGIQGYAKAEDLGARYVWAPIIIQDPNGKLNDGANTYSLGFATRLRVNADGTINSESTMLNMQTGYFVYYKGSYYYALTYYQDRLNSFGFANRSSQSNLFKQPSYAAPSGGGSVEPTPNTTTFKNEPSYLGGIVGYADSANISNCTSTNTGNDEDVLQALENSYEYYHNDGDMPLLGVYSGGIVGYAKNNQVYNCSTLGGYVMGSNYVGGIVGFAENSKILTATGANRANVVGSYYVGGIVGSNATVSLEKDANGFALINHEYTPSLQIENWVNKGIVIATHQFGGGITGYNAGNILNCSSDVNMTEFFSSINQKHGGDYIGGISGYNDGQIVVNSSYKHRNVSSYVIGKNYVGGIVGLNGEASNIALSGYTYSGGYVYGNNFVGGYVGLNLSESFLANNSNGKGIVSNPNMVVGNYYVGGVIGGNILATNNVVSATFTTNNFLGVVRAKAFAGGFIGYNLIINKTEDYAENLKNSYINLATNSSSASLQNVVSLVESVSNKPEVSLGKLRLQGENSNKFAGIYADVYVGGAIGYNSKTTKTVIEGVVNKSPIYAYSSIEANELVGAENTNIYTGKAKSYSYAGGIVGKCTQNMIIKNCYGDDSSRVVSAGTYLGGLVEVNEGTIESCLAVTLGSGANNYTGGIVGLNKQSGKIYSPKLNNKTVTGNNVVGGITAENYGVISSVNGQASILGNVYATGKSIGGIAGINHETAEISNLIICVSINGTGENVGGGIGENYGSIVNVRGDSKKSLTVTGKTNVGGIIGVNKSKTAIENCINYNNVNANYGYAGGVVALASSGSIINCENNGAVTSIGVAAGFNSLAGGIVANYNVENGLVESCVNSGAVQASQGSAGGIVATNGGTVKGCEVNAKTTVTGYWHSGGAVAINYNLVDNTIISSAMVENLANSPESAIGGAVGYNNGDIKNTNVYNTKITLMNGGSHGGGIVGINKKQISNCNFENSSVAFNGLTANYYGNLGGIVGTNEGVVSNCAIAENAIVKGTANNPSNPPKYNPNYDYEDGVVVYGYGGIAGVNGTAANEIVSATIENCKVGDGAISVTGSAANIANIGGVAGVNGKDAVIKGIEITATKQFSIKAEFANIGGAVGYNYGMVEKFGKQVEEGFGDGSTPQSEESRLASADTETIVAVETSKGHIGGIIGYNRTSAIVRFCNTGSKWTVNGTGASTDNGTGGIVGYNMAAYGILGCNNWASVTRVNTITAVGGIVGRHEPTSTSTWEIRDCNNMGDVTGSRVGGIMGNWKYRGGTIANCSNYGTITNTSNGEPAAGIVGLVYQLNNNEYITITNCKNFGSILAARNITASAAGGIVGLIPDRNRNVKATIANCVNTGLITTDRATYSAGIVANSSIRNDVSGESYRLEILNCANYGVPDSNSRAFSGIINYTTAANKVLVANCVGVAGLTNTTGIYTVNYPITNISYASASNNNYYFTQDKKTSGQGIALNLVTENNITKAYNGDELVFDNLTFGTGTYNQFVSDFTSTLRVRQEQNNLRQQTYLEINSKVASGGEGGIPTVENLQFKDNGGSIIATWNATNAYYYITEIEFDDGTYITDIVYTKRININTANKPSQQMRVTITAVSANGNKASIIGTIGVKAAVLTDVSARLVLYDTSIANCYKIYIDNVQNYIEIINDKTNDVEKINAIVVVNGSTKTIEITGAGYNLNNAVVSGHGLDNVVITTQAIAYKSNGQVSDIYGVSQTNVRESVVMRNSDYQNSNAVTPSISSNGFTGDSSDTLAFKLATRGNQRSIFYRHDIVATMDIGGVSLPIAIASSEGQITTSTSLEVTINDLPVDIGDTAKYQNLYVRSYPLAASNNMVYMLNDLGTYNSEELLQLQVTQTGEIGSLNLIENNSLRAGYAIALEGEDLYRVMFSPLLRLATNVGSMHYQTIRFNNIASSIKSAPQPVINTAYNDEAETYTASWSASAQGYTPRYTYSLVGINTLGDSVLITRQTSPTTTSSISLETSNWNYERVVLTVNALGLQTSSGATQYFSAQSVETTQTKIKLRQITLPVVTLKDSDKDNLVYTISWNGITNEQETYEYVSHYRVEIKAYVDDNPNKVTAFYNTSHKDISNIDVDFDNLVYINESGEQAVGCVQGNSEVEISVRAIAVPNNTYYNSPSGLVYVQIVPKRLETPNIEKASFKINFVPIVENVATIEQFEENGFVITYVNHESEDAQELGKYQIAIDLVNDEGEIVKQIATKETPITLDGSYLGEEVVKAINKTDGITIAHSNLNLSFSMRAVSDSRITSLWSKAAVYKLPRVQISTLDVYHAFVARTIAYPIYEGEHPSTSGVLVDIVQDTFEWKQTEYTSGYNLALKRQGDNSNDYLNIVFEMESYTESEPHLTYYSENSYTYDEQGNVTYNEKIVDYTKEVDLLTTTYTFALSDYSFAQKIVDSNGVQIGNYNVPIDAKLVVKVHGNGDDHTILDTEYILYLPDVTIPITSIPLSVSRQFVFTKSIFIVAKTYNENYVNASISGAQRENQPPYRFAKVENPTEIDFPFN